MARHDRPCRNFGEFGDHECLCINARLRKSEYTSLCACVREHECERTEYTDEGANGFERKARIRVLFSKDRAIFQNFTHVARDFAKGSPSPRQSMNEPCRLLKLMEVF